MDWHGIGATVVAPVTVAGVSVVEEGCSTVEVVGIVETTIDGRTVGLVSVAGALLVEPAFVVASSGVDDAPDEHDGEDHDESGSESPSRRYLQSHWSRMRSTTAGFACTSASPFVPEDRCKTVADRGCTTPVELTVDWAQYSVVWAPARSLATKTNSSSSLSPWRRASTSSSVARSRLPYPSSSSSSLTVPKPGSRLARRVPIA